MSDCSNCLGCGLTELTGGAIGVKVDPNGAIGLDATDPYADPAVSGLYVNVDGTTVLGTYSGGTPGISVAAASAGGYLTLLELAGGINVVPSLIPPFYRSFPNAQPASSLFVNSDALGAYTTSADTPAVPAGMGGLYAIGATFLIDYFGSSTVFDPDGMLTFGQAISVGAGFLNLVPNAEVHSVPISTVFQRRVHGSTVMRLEAGQWVRLELTLSQNHVVDTMTLTTARLGD